MPADGPGEHDFFKIAAFLYEVFYGVPVGDTHHVLFNDWAVVENVGDVVAGSANQFDTPLERLVIRFRSHESRQERMVNVDDFLRKGVDEVFRKNLNDARNVAGQFSTLVTIE